MAGKKSFSFFSFFKAKKSSRRDQDYGEDGWNTRKVYPSEEDNTICRVVAKPGIDKMASDFIANFHATRVSEALTKHAENDQTAAK